MSRRNRRPDWRRIKSLRSYTIEEAARALNVHRNAVRYWIKKGGLPIFMDQRPYLIHGGDLGTFLRDRREAKRQRCGPGQLFCLKCRKPQIPHPGLVDLQAVSARIAIVGLCPTCETLMYRFVSRARLAAAAREFKLQIAEQETSLGDTVQPSADCHFEKKDRTCPSTMQKTNAPSEPTSPI